MDPEGSVDGQELGGIEGGETIIRIQCISKETIFK